jgi:hypothetical protein
MKNESKPILHKGTGTPYLALFDNKGNPIRDPQTGDYISSFISSFRHKLGGENSDEDSQLVVNFNYNNPNLIDIDSLQAKRYIFFQYGYVFPDRSFTSGPVYSMKILRFDMNLSPSGCNFTLYAKDTSIDLRYEGTYIPNGDNEYTFKKLMDTGFSNGTQDYPVIILKF